MLLGHGYPIGETGRLDGDGLAAITQKTLDDTVVAVAAERRKPADVSPGRSRVIRRRC
jgi:hypothetical protein